MILFFLSLERLGQAQDTQFLFDLRGNLTAWTAATNLPPQIVGQPKDQLVQTGQPASFSVVVANPRGLTYQWKHNGNTLGGFTNDSLAILAANTNLEGSYEVVLANSSGSVTSAPAMLWIDNDGDGMADSWELNFFGNLDQLPNGDFDGDGSSNLQEFLNGSDPKNANSTRFNLTVLRDGGSVLVSPDLPAYTNGQAVTLTAIPSANESFHAWIGSIASRDNPITLVMTNNKTIDARFFPITFTWTNLAGGDWNGATNWEPNLVPATNDLAVVTLGVIVTLNTSAGCGDLLLGNGGNNPELTGSGSLSLFGNGLWISGTMSGTGRTIVAPGATLAVTNPVAVSLASRVLENNGTVLLTGTGPFFMSSSAVVSNRPGALFDVQNASGIGGSGRFDNAGTLRKSINAAAITIPSGLAFNNTGMVQVQSGTLSFDGGLPNSGTIEIENATLACNAGFTNNGVVNLLSAATNRITTGGIANGTFNALAGSSVEWTAGNFALNASAQLNGGGLYRINGATLNFNASLTVSNLDLVSISGILNVVGTLTIAGTMNWTAGTMTGSGGTLIAPAATLVVPNPGGVSLASSTLENAGTVNWTGPGSIGLNSGSVITNRVGALFDVRGVGLLGAVFLPDRIDNAGTFRKSGTNGTATVGSGVNFNNFGTVEIQLGTLQCDAPFSNGGTVVVSAGATNRLNGGGSGGGTFNTLGGSVVEWTGGTFSPGSPAQFLGNGLYRINGGTLTCDTDYAVNNFDLVLGTLNGTGAVAVLNAMNWTGGTMSGGGRTIIAAGATMNFGQANLNGRTLENGGTVLWTSTGLILSSAVITNRAGALFDAQNNVSPFFAGVACRFDNAGTFRKSASIGVTTLPSGVSFNNFGTTEIQTGTLQIAGGGSASGSFTVSPSSQLEWPSGGFTLNPGAQLNGAGLFKISGATVVDNTSVVVSNLDLTAGTLDGTGILTIAGTMNWTGGTMSGTGQTLISPGAALNLPGSTTVFLGRTIENAGTFLWTGVGNLGMGVITNRPGALVDVRNSAALTFFAPNPRFDNAGTFRKSVSSGATTMNPNFTNYGTIEIQTGTLLCNSAFANNSAVILSAGTTHRLAGGGSAIGTFDAPATALVEWTGGAFTLNAGAQLNGGGLYKINGPSLTANTDINVSNLDLAVGSLDGAGIVTISNAMNWIGGSMSGTGRTLIAISATLNINNPGAIALNPRTLENAGTANWTGAGGIQFIGALITNRPGALFQAQNAAAFSSISSTRFDNAGTFRKSVNAGTTTVNVDFNNYGALELQTGTFTTGNPFVNKGSVNLSTGASARIGAGGSATGTFDTPATALMEWIGGNFALNIGSQLNGVGQYRINGGFLVGNTNLTVENLDLNAGSLDGPSVVTIAHAMNWTGGSMDGSGRTLITPSATLGINSPSSGLSISRTLENGGTTTWAGAGNINMVGSIFTNRAGALFHVQNSAQFVGTTRFDNSGTFRKSISTGTTTIPNNVAFNNFGIVDLRSGILLANGGYAATPNSLLSCALGGASAGTGYGQLQVPGTVTLNGALGLDLVNGFVPTTNNAFTVVSAGTRNGAFGSFSYPSNAVTMQLSNTANSVIARVTDVFIIQQPAPLPAGIISWWRAEGNALDSIGTNHGVLTNGAAFATGQVGQTFAFDGVDDYVQVPDSASLRPASVTIEAWVKFFATNGIRIVLGKPLGNNTTFDSYGLALQDGAVLAAICDNSGFGAFLTGPANTVTGQWYHLAYTFDDASKQQVLYVNGAPVARGTANKTIGYDTHPLFLGADLENGALAFFQNGLIDETSLYSRALTRDEVVTIYNAGSLGKQLSTNIPRPLLLTPEISGPKLKLTWTSVSNIQYRVEFNPNPSASNWTALPGDITALSNTAAKLDSLTMSNRFYRVRVVP